MISKLQEEIAKLTATLQTLKLGTGQRSEPQHTICKCIDLVIVEIKNIFLLTLNRIYI
jgi:hypothetical protein